MSKSPRDDLPKGLTHNPFAALRPDGNPAPSVKPEKTAATTDQPPATAASQVVVRREKKGRGGKTVTRVSGLELNAKDLTSLARDLKKGLGCGASVDGEDILLQGALTERAAAWLEARRGVRVTIGN